MAEPDVPQEWVDAAMAVLGDGEWDRACEGDYAERQGLLAIALEATAPLIAAAERDEIVQFAKAEAERIRNANFSNLDATWAGTLEDFAERIHRSAP